MRFLIIIFFSFFLVPNTYSENISRLGCNWNIPDRFINHGYDAWSSVSGDFSAVYFKQGKFDESMIEILGAKSIRGQRLAFSKESDGFKLDIYEEYFLGNDSVSFLSWVVIMSGSEDGVFYLHGLSPEEINGFVSSCMPSLIL